MRLFSMNRYAAVVGTLALFVSVSGTSYAVGNALANNSVGSAQIKAGAVQNSDIGKNAVTGGKVKDNTLTGADIKESSLGAVPNASKVNSQGIYKIRYTAGANTGSKTLLNNVGGLTLKASCGVSGALTFTATTSKNGSSIYAQVLPDVPPIAILEKDYESGTFSTASTFDMLAGDDGDIAIVTFTYEAPDNTVATGVLTSDNAGGALPCHISGHVTIG